MSAPLPAELLAVISSRDMLPTVLPANPMDLFKQWFDEQVAAARQPNPNAMTIATIGLNGFPRVRVVLCRGIDTASGYLTFFTNYQGDKGKELEANPKAAATFHWDHAEIQVRFEGLCVRSPDAESDAYFARRPWESRLAAWASDQSRPLKDRQQLIDQYSKAIEHLGLAPDQILRERAAVNIPRPPHWGGFRLWAQRVELWLGGLGRMHDRAAWQRNLMPRPDGFSCSPWTASRLQP